MAFGDKTITFSEAEVNWLQSITEEFRESAEGQVNFTTTGLINSVRTKLANTPASPS